MVGAGLVSEAVTAVIQELRLQISVASEGLFAAANLSLQQQVYTLQPKLHSG